MQARRRELPLKIVAWLRKTWPSLVAKVDDADLAYIIRQGIVAAANHGLTVEWDLCRFCWLVLLHGADFDHDKDWARAILAEPALTAAQKIDRLEHYHLNYLAQFCK